jgi:hypothetical protein
MNPLRALRVPSTIRQTPSLALPDYVDYGKSGLGRGDYGFQLKTRVRIGQQILPVLLSPLLGIQTHLHEQVMGTNITSVVYGCPLLWKLYLPLGLIYPHVLYLVSVEANIVDKDLSPRLQCRYLIL